MHMHTLLAQLSELILNSHAIQLSLRKCVNLNVAPPPPRKTRAELMKDIDADYYGYRDEDDGLIVPLEQEMEKKGTSRSSFI